MLKQPQIFGNNHNKQIIKIHVYNAYWPKVCLLLLLLKVSVVKNCRGFMHHFKPNLPLLHHCKVMLITHIIFVLPAQDICTCSSLRVQIVIGGFDEYKKGAYIIH